MYVSMMQVHDGCRRVECWWGRDLDMENILI